MPWHALCLVALFASAKANNLVRNFFWILEIKHSYTPDGPVWKNSDGTWDTPYGEFIPDKHGGYEHKDGYLEPDGNGGYYFHKY